MAQTLVNEIIQTPAVAFLEAVTILDKFDTALDRDNVSAQADVIHALNIASADIPAVDLPNAVHRISAAIGMLDMICSKAECGEDTEDMIEAVGKLLLRGLEGLDHVTSFDRFAWRFDYLSGRGAAA